MIRTTARRIQERTQRDHKRHGGGGEDDAADAAPTRKLKISIDAITAVADETSAGRAATTGISATRAWPFAVHRAEQGGSVEPDDG